MIGLPVAVARLSSVPVVLAFLVAAGSPAASASVQQSPPPSPASGAAPGPVSTNGLSSQYPIPNRLDPERPAPIVGWWVNGEQLLEIAPDGAYRLYETTNRYRKPIENGRWHRQNYIAFWLEPYSMRKEERARVSLSEVDGLVRATLRKFQPMTLQNDPPMCEEDLFIGLWSGVGGTLELQASMRYHFVAPRSSGTSQPVMISSHKGAWRLKDGQVELLPDSPSVAALTLEPQRGASPSGTASDGVSDPSRPFVDEADLFMQLRGVEGTLDRIVARPTVGPPAAPTTPPAVKVAPTANPNPKPAGTVPANEKSGS